MRRQRHVFDRRIPAIRNKERPHEKPEYGTGFWTSTLGQRGGWLDVVDGGDVNFASPYPREEWRLYAVYPYPDARVYEIDTHDDLLALIDRYPHGAIEATDYGVLDFRHPDFEAVARDYDAVHLTDDGMVATRLATPGTYTWDCESTIWFRACFRAIAEISAETAYANLGREPFTSPYDVDVEEIAA